MRTLTFATLSLLPFAPQGTAEPLNHYTRVTTRLLDNISEASAVAFNPDTGTLFSIATRDKRSSNSARAETSSGP